MMEVTQRTGGENGIHGGQLLLALQFVRHPSRLHATGAELSTPSSDDSSRVPRPPRSLSIRAASRERPAK